VLALVIAFAATPALSQAQDALGSMTLREKVGQLVMFSVDGTSLSATERDLIRRHHLGGVILFAKNYEDRDQVAALNRAIQKAVRAGSSGVGALISVDQEGGVVKRFPDMAPWHSAPEIGASSDETLASREGRLTGRALHSVGVNVDLAPVADLDLPPEHVMRSRSFGSGEQRVGNLVRDFVRGLQSNGVAATAKHFPGLGGATQNSDFGRAFVYRNRWKLRNIDAVPFRKAIGGGIRMIMLSHAIYPKDGGKRPASINRHVAVKRLRKQLGFSGVAISDALEAVNWWFDGDTARACRATIWAGSDIALITGDAHAARSCAAQIVGGVRSGAIPRARLDAAVLRVLQLKKWLGLL
jgi:beta-N-acetylhexosaminidase